MKIDIFCESGKKYGLGHLRRCENLLEVFKQALHPLNLESTFHSLPCTPPAQSYDIVIIDSYIMSLSDYEFLAKHSKAMLCLDDFNRLKYPKKALILSPTFKKKGKYSGKDYVILHPSFVLPNTQKEAKNHLLITLGGSNQSILLEQILDILPSFISPHIIHPTFSHPLHPASSNLSPQEICNLIDKSEIIITAGGGSLNESISRGKKIIALCISSNQKSQLNAYKNKFPIIFNPHNQLSFKLKSALTHAKPLHLNFGTKLPKLAQIFLYRSLQLPRNIKPFFALTKFEKKQILRLRNQQEVRQASFNTGQISLKTHLKFINSLKTHQMYFAFFHHQRIVGIGSLHLISSQKAVLGIYKDMKIKNMGKKILDSLICIASKLGISEICLEVLSHNAQAISFYQKHGFCIIGTFETYLLMEYKGAK